MLNTFTNWVANTITSTDVDSKMDGRTQPKHGSMRKRSNFVPKQDRKFEHSIFFVTLASSASEKNGSVSTDFQCAGYKSNKRNADHGGKRPPKGALYQCQETDGGNAIECELSNINVSHIA